jgi:hypothetical protein
MKVLVACEYSGRVRDAFRLRGHDAISCDLLPSDKPGPHFEGDVREIINDGFDLMVAHPPCTYLSNASVCHLHTDPKRWIDLFEAADFFKFLLDAPIDKICIENPIMHKYAKRLIGDVKQSQTIQPYHFGHLEQKATCLWLKGLDPLVHTSDLKRETKELPDHIRQRLHYLPPSEDRWKLRSTTYQGIADAMANQWGGWVSMPKSL